LSHVTKIPVKRYDVKIEEEVKEFWEKEKIYEELREKLKDKPKFYFLDGPPYPSSNVMHVGTGWNKVLKDTVIRFRRMQGYYVRDQPGFDCHGLPIEVAVEKKLGFKSKKDIENYGVDNFVNKCRELALNNVKALSEQFKELGVSMQWDNPYLTLNKEYIESAWWIVKKAHEEGLLEKGVRVLHWCPRCETVLADYEVSEYKDLTDPSIYVKFPIGENRYILIWTTTPWTLPANVGVMVNPDFEYAEVEVDGEILIMAKERVEHVLKEAGKEGKIIRTFKGSELEGLTYTPPLLEEVTAQRIIQNAHRVVLSSEYVTLEEGTGCVHMATGHGAEDFEVGSKYGIPVLSLVDDKGRFVKEAGKYAGKPVREANKEIIEDLKRKGLLFHASTIVHKYPVCWRCKTPLILRATEQWFVKVTQLKEKMKEEADKINWIPKWAGASRFKNWLEGLRDWVITRQRYWGTPAPIWVCEKCGYYEVIGSLEELKSKSPKAAELKDLHKPWIDSITYQCPKCGGTMKRIPDVLDVWLDSGVAFYASLGYPRNKKEFDTWWPVDFIVEGHDQISGWFYSLLRSGVIGFGQAPYKTVLMHGFALDEKGREMHKSLGNFVPVTEVIKRGRDVFRLYVLSNTVWEDLRFSWEGMRQALSDLNVMWNVYMFASIYMELDKFNPYKYSLADLKRAFQPEDLWILARLQSLIVEVTDALENYNISSATRALRSFIVEDVSHRYIRFIRRRVWIEEEDPAKITAYYILYKVLKTFLLLAAPFIPYVTEYIYQKMFRNVEGVKSIHMMEWPKVEEEWKSVLLEREMVIVNEILETGFSARMKAGIKIRQPLPEAIIFSDDSDVATAVARFNKLIAEQLNVREVKFEEPVKLSYYRALRVEPQMSRLGPLYKDKAPKIAEALRAKKASKIVEELERRHYIEVEVDSERIRVDASCIKLIEGFKEDYVAQEFSRGLILLNKKLSEYEIKEGIARDLVRRIQFMRKELNLPVDAFIDVEVYASEEVRKVEKEFKDYIMHEVRAKTLVFRDLKEYTKTEKYSKEWDLDGEKVIIAIKMVEK